jgi:hypothetical protein
VLTHARALLTSDFTQPIALMLVGILPLIPDEDKPGDIMATLLDSLPPGQLSHRLPRHGGIRSGRDDGPRPMPAKVNTNGGVARKPQ